MKTLDILVVYYPVCWKGLINLSMFSLYEQQMNINFKNIIAVFKLECIIICIKVKYDYFFC